MLQIHRLRLDHGALEGEKPPAGDQQPHPLFFLGCGGGRKRTAAGRLPGDGFQRSEPAVGQRLDRPGGPGASVCRPAPSRGTGGSLSPLKSGTPAGNRACRLRLVLPFRALQAGPPGKLDRPAGGCVGPPAVFPPPLHRAPRPGERGAVRLRPGVPPGRAGRRRLDRRGSRPGGDRLFQTGFLCISARAGGKAQAGGALPKRCRGRGLAAQRGAVSPVYRGKGHPVFRPAPAVRAAAPWLCRRNGGDGGGRRKLALRDGGNRQRPSVQRRDHRPAPGSPRLEPGGRGAEGISAGAAGAAAGASRR